MSGKIVYQIDGNGMYVGEVIADSSPLEPGVFLIPAGCVEAVPPADVEGMARVYINEKWGYVPLGQSSAVPATDPIDVPPTVPSSVTAAQGGIALIRAGLMEAVQGVVDAPETPAEVKWAWSRATTWDRLSPALAYIADKASITPQQMDDLFITAGTIQA